MNSPHKLAVLAGTIAQGCLPAASGAKKLVKQKSGT